MCVERFLFDFILSILQEDITFQIIQQISPFSLSNLSNKPLTGFWTQIIFSVSLKIKLKQKCIKYGFEISFI